MMAQEDIFKEFIDRLKKEKKPGEMGKFLADLFKYSAAELYFAMVSFLKEEDFEAIDKIPDDVKAEEEVKNRFKSRTGMTPVEFVDKLRDTIAKNYLFPELYKKTQ